MKSLGQLSFIVHCRSIAFQSDLSATANSVWAQLRLILTELLEYPESLRERITGMLKAGAKTPIRAMRALHRALSNEPGLIPEALALLNDWEKRIRRRAKEMHDLRNKLIFAHHYGKAKIRND